MKLPVVIMNFSGIYNLEEFSQNNKFKWIDCRHLEGTDCYCDPDNVSRLRECLAPYPAKGIHFIDSGNYHYMSKFWTDKIEEPFSLIVFDHHPDMQLPLFKGVLSCGDWVLDVIKENPLLRKVVIIGVSDRLLASIPEEYAHRVRFYSESSLRHESTWREFSKIHVDGPVYISIDKDVLDKRSARTNWDQGSLALERMEELITTIFRHEEVIGVDICGECSMDFDLFDVDEDSRVDSRANEALLELIERDCERYG